MKISMLISLLVISVTSAATHAAEKAPVFRNPGLPEDLLNLCRTEACDSVESLQIESLEVSGAILIVNTENQAPIAVITSSPSQALDIAHALENFQEVQLKVRRLSQRYVLVSFSQD